MIFNVIFLFHVLHYIIYYLWFLEDKELLIVVTRPKTKEERRLQLESAIEQEQREKELELMQKQKEAEIRL